MQAKITAEQQYRELKAKYEDSILFFRMGDFYELFDDDAINIGKLIGLTVTSRDKGEVKRPMAGIPVHALDTYLGKIVNLGFSVAIAEQMEDPKNVKGIVHRDVVKVVTAGTLIDEKNLKPDNNNYIACIFIDNKNAEIYSAFLEYSTGEFFTYQTKLTDLSRFVNILKSKSPKEILVNIDDKKIFEKIVFCKYKLIDEYNFELKNNIAILQKHFVTQFIHSYGYDEADNVLICAGQIIHYLKNIQRSDLNHIRKLYKYNESREMILESSTIKNLEILDTLNLRSENTYQNTLIKLLDETNTPMGKRLLRKWLVSPLTDINEILSRQSVVDFFVNYKDLEFTKIYDIERLVGKIGVESILPKDIICLKLSLLCIFENINKFLSITNIGSEEDFSYSGIDTKNELPHIINNLLTFKPFIQEFLTFIDNALLDEPNNNINEGYIFKQNYNSEIDELRNYKQNANDWLKNFQEEEIQKSGIHNLKVKFNSVFGFYIEISNSQIGKVPENYIRKQTLVNGERYITNELKEMEDKILHSDEKLFTLEHNLYVELRKKLCGFIDSLQAIANIVASIDVLSNFANISRKYNFTKPIIFDKNTRKILNIRNGRHPVIENLVKEKYVNNDINLDESKEFVILTGPNMSGKSTYLRMVAMVIIMGQIGCYVPADLAEFRIIDKIYTRIGASDNLSSGESTFMVEMNETANILHNATDHSLVILDEVGRGTSTYDGVAIAWSIVKYILQNIGSFTLFATHYHELSKLEYKYSKIVNRCVQVLEKNEEIIFMYKIIDGSAEKSFGVHVAKLAGMPKEIISEADNILKQFEVNKIHKLVNKKDISGELNVEQIQLF